jgi:hypothetical protein
VSIICFLTYFSTLLCVRYRITRDVILGCHAACPVLDFALRRLMASFELQRRGYRARRGCRSGQHVRRSRLPPSRTTSAALRLREIPTITGNRRYTMSTYRVDSVACRRRELIDVITHQIPPTRPSPLNAPSIYMLNAAALSKPGAVQHLAVFLESYGASVAVITETHENQAYRQYRQHQWLHTLSA